MIYRSATLLAYLLLAAAPALAGVAATQRAALVGQWGLEVTANPDGSAAFVENREATLQSSIGIEVKMNLDNAQAVDGSAFRIIRGQDTNRNALFDLRVTKISGGFSATVGSSTGRSQPALMPPGIVTVRVDWARAGEMSLSVDGLNVASITADPIEGHLRTIAIGATDTTEGLGGWLAFDDVRYLGDEPATTVSGLDSVELKLKATNDGDDLR